MKEHSVCAVCGHDEAACTFEEVYRRAKELVGFKQECSAALLQRDLKISYAKAVAVIEMMEEAGLVGPAHGANHRRVSFKAEDRS